MIIQKIVVDNFMSYYGRTELLLPKGLNFIAGPAGSGKTNLWKAFCLAITGHSPDRFTALNRMINNHHRQESANPTARVEIQFNHEGRKWSAARSLSITGETIVQSFKADLAIDELEIPSPSYHCIYIDPEMMDQLSQEHKDWPVGRRWAHSIMRDLKRNSENGIKTAIIDGAFEYLNADYREKVLTFADESPMEQLIVMVKTLLGNIQNHPHTTHHIEYDPKNLSSRIVERKETTAG